MRRIGKTLFAVTVMIALHADAAWAQRGAPPCSPRETGLKVADDFCAILFASDIRGARHLVVAPNGDVIVTSQGGRGGGGGAFVLRDTDRDGKADTKEPLGTPSANGIALAGDQLYIATNDAVLRYRLPAGATTTASGPDTIVYGLPDGGHAAKSIAITGNDLFVNIGSRTNSCQTRDRQNEVPGDDPCVELETRAGIWRFDLNRTKQRQQDGERFATGLRNVVALSVDPATGRLYGMQHGRDQLFQNWGALGYDSEDGAELPSEEFVQIGRGDNFGWPYCYHDRFKGHLVLAPEYGGDGTRTGRCESMKEPLVAFPGHWAPNGLAFYRLPSGTVAGSGASFPASYAGGAFIAFHGSWNRAPLPQQGYKLVFQPMSDGRPSGEWKDVIEDFRVLQPSGKPVGVAVGPDGSLYVSDDTGGRVFRIVRR